MTSLIVFDSPEYACFHEAGHAELAVYLGARVEEIVLHRAAPRTYGRTRVHRTQDQRRPISLGGFAAEYILFKNSRLRKHDGKEPSEKEFIDYAMDNVSEDLTLFFGSDTRGLDDTALELLHRQFMGEAIYHAERRMRFQLVEQLAVALLKADRLVEADVDGVVHRFYEGLVSGP